MPVRKRGSSQTLVPISITTDTLFRILFIVVGAILIYYLWNIVVILIVAVLLAALIDPFADKLATKSIPRGIAVGIIYLVILAALTGIFFLVVPSSIEQMKGLVQTYHDQIAIIGVSEDALRFVTSGEFFEQDFYNIVAAIKESGIPNSVPILVTTFFDAFRTMFTVLLVAILAYYMVVEERGFKEDVVKWLTPKKYKDLVAQVMPKVKLKLGFWLRGQLTIMFIIFVLTFIVLTVLGVPFALVLAITAGLLEIVPFLGPILASIPAILIAFSISPIQAFLVALFYFLIQQLEADFLTPKIMQKVIGINPIASIVSVLVGLELIGFAGALFAVPIAMVVGLFLHEWFSAKESADA